MKIHWGKAEVMVVSRQGEECKVCVDEKEIEQVQNMKYLGTILRKLNTEWEQQPE